MTGRVRRIGGWSAAAVGLALGGPLAAAVARAEEPLGLVEETVDEATRQADADYRAGVRATKLGKNADAIVFFERALPKKHDTADLFYNLVQVAKLQRAWEKVALYGQAFVLLEPGTKDATAVGREVDQALETLAKRGKVAVAVELTVPDGGKAFVDGAPVADHGHAAVRLVPGTYALTAEKVDHKPFAQPLVVAAGAVARVKVELERIIYHGQVAIASTPADGVQVFVDGERVGETPLKAPLELEAGRKLLFRFEKQGFEPWVRYVELGKNESVKLEPKLEKVPVPFVPPPRPGPKGG